MIKVYGCSDDYIIAEGDNYSFQYDLTFGEECCVVFADGTSFVISYGNQGSGTWDVTNLVKGSKFVELIPNKGDDSPDYSDIVVINECDCLAPVCKKI